MWPWTTKKKWKKCDPGPAFKVVQSKFLAMHITNKKWSFDLFTVRNSQNIFMELT